MTFYWLASRQWLFLLLERLSVEHPVAVVQMAAVLSQEALKPAEPHLLTVQFAKRAALRVASHDASVYDAATLRELKRCLKSPFAIRRRSRGGDRRRATRVAAERRFRFDEMDTIPYWYSRLAEVFDVDAQQVCDEVELYVCDKWGFFEKVWQQDKVAKWNRDERDWTLRSHRHGAEPTVENLDRYLEFNGMQCAALSMLQKEPTYLGPWGEGGWEGWLSRWDLLRGGEWLSDMRQPTPLDDLFWGASRSDWQSAPTQVEFDVASGLHNPLHTDCLMCYGDWSRYKEEDYESTNVDSALVSEGTGQALLFALAGSEHPSDYRIPTEGDELEIDDCIGDIPFALTGWVKVGDPDSGNIESHDPLRYEFSLQSIEPGTAFRRWAKLKFGDDRGKLGRGGHAAIRSPRRWRIRTVATGACCHLPIRSRRRHAGDLVVIVLPRRHPALEIVLLFSQRFWP
ncbi:MAG: hypothetical protein ACREHD_06285, partial [Pirellulales bacterium]